MKKTWKLLAVLLGLSLVLIGGGCSDDDDDDYSAPPVNDDTQTVAYSKTFTGTGNPIKVIDATALAGKNIENFIITVTNYTANSGNWLSAYPGDNWAEPKWEGILAAEGLIATITDADTRVQFIAAAKKNGVYIAANNGLDCTVTIAYTLETDITPGSFVVTQGTATSTTIPLSWTEAENATRYTVQYKTGNGAYSEAVTVGSTSYTITGLTAATEYTILVTAYSGSLSTPADAVNATTLESVVTTNTAISSESITITSEGTYQLAVSHDTIKNYTKVYITLANITEWGSGSYEKPCLGTSVNAWKADTAWEGNDSFTDSNVEGESGGYFAEILTSDYPEGVFITGKTGLAGTLYITGIN